MDPSERTFELRSWSEPVARTREAGLPASNAWSALVALRGNYANFDLYCSAAVDRGGRNAAGQELSLSQGLWMDAEFRVLAIQAGAESVLLQRLIGDAQMLRGRAGTLSGAIAVPNQPWTGLVASIRGRKCDALRVEGRSPEEQPLPRPRATWVLVAWGRTGVYGDQASVLPVSPYAMRDRAWDSQSRLTQVNLTEVVLGDPSQQGLPGQRSYVTHLDVTGDLTQTTTLSLVDSDGFVDTTHWTALVGPDLPLVVSFPMPLRSSRGALWELRAGAIPANEELRVNVSGFLE